METFEDRRTPGQKSADLEISQMRLELEEIRRELAGEGDSRAVIFLRQVEFLEDKIAGLYCELYETDAD